MPTLDASTAAAPNSDAAVRDAASAEGSTCADVLAWVKQREVGATKEKEDGALDFSSSYVLHAFDNGFEEFLGKGKEIDVRYVLERRSNYARAVFPAVWRAVEEGVIPKEEVSWLRM